MRHLHANKWTSLHGLLLCCCLLWTGPSGAREPLLRFAIYENLDYPINIFDKNHVLTGGLLKDFGDQIAKKLAVPAVYALYSRRRIELVVQLGEADILCYSSPAWSDQPKDLHWTIPTFPQVERVVVMNDKPGVENFTTQLEGKRLVLQLGYHYPQIANQLNEGKIRRIDLTDVPSMFRLLALGGADAMVSSESEIEGYFKNFPEKRSLYKVSKTAFSVVQTQCALSQKSVWKLDQINAAIQSLQDSGEIEKMMRKYGLSMR